MFVAALGIATAVPIVFLYIIYTQDLYKTGAFRTVVLCFVWGVIAFGIAYYANTALVVNDVLTRRDVVRFAAPVGEEVYKGLVLIFLVRRPNFTYFVDGAIYGYAAGIGFAIVENYQYVLDNQHIALLAAGSRVISTNLMHATASGLVGIALGMARFKRRSGQGAFLIGGLLFAMSVHVAFNNLVTLVSSSLLLVYAAASGLGGTAFVVAAIKRGLADEKAWIEETLGEADRVTAGEAAVVHRISDMQEILAPLAERFGEEKASQISGFLMLQARLGILRKTLEKLHDEKMKRAVEAQMAALREQMDSARRAVGTYCMLYLRQIFPEEASPLWGRLEHVIQEQAAARPANGGVNLWGKLEQRTAAGAQQPGG